MAGRAETSELLPSGEAPTRKYVASASTAKASGAATAAKASGAATAAKASGAATAAKASNAALGDASHTPDGRPRLALSGARLPARGLPRQVIAAPVRASVGAPQGVRVTAAQSPPVVAPTPGRVGAAAVERRVLPPPRGPRVPVVGDARQLPGPPVRGLGAEGDGGADVGVGVKAPSAAVPAPEAAGRAGPRGAAGAVAARVASAGGRAGPRVVGRGGACVQRGPTRREKAKPTDGAPMEKRKAAAQAAVPGVVSRRAATGPRVGGVGAAAAEAVSVATTERTLAAVGLLPARFYVLRRLGARSAMVAGRGVPEVAGEGATVAGRTAAGRGGVAEAAAEGARAAGRKAAGRVAVVAVVAGAGARVVGVAVGGVAGEALLAPLCRVFVHQRRGRPLSTCDGEPVSRYATRLARRNRVSHLAE